MTTKHTPGPWVEAADGWIDGKGGLSVMEYAGCGTHEAEYPNPADKPLILAAPAMLAALKSARAMWGDYLPPGNSNAMKAMREVDEAIALATLYTNL